VHQNDPEIVDKNNPDAWNARFSVTMNSEVKYSGWTVSILVTEHGFVMACFRAVSNYAGPNSFTAVFCFSGLTKHVANCVEMSRGLIFTNSIDRESDRKLRLQQSYCARLTSWCKAPLVSKLLHPTCSNVTTRLV
jgi:hypothetical protein